MASGITGTAAGTLSAPSPAELPCICEQTENAHRLLTVLSANVDHYTVDVLEKYAEYSLAIIEGCFQAAKVVFTTAGGLINESVSVAREPTDIRIVGLWDGICQLDTARFHLHDLTNDAWSPTTDDLHRILADARDALNNATSQFNTFTETELADQTQSTLEESNGHAVTGSDTVSDESKTA